MGSLRGCTEALSWLLPYKGVASGKTTSALELIPVPKVDVEETQIKYGIYLRQFTMTWERICIFYLFICFFEYASFNVNF